MTKKDYIIIAEALKQVKPYDEKTLEEGNYCKNTQDLFLDVVDSLCDELEKDNKKFDARKFFNYIGVYKY